MICDGDSKAYSTIWDSYGCCETCEKWENADKRSADYKKWRNSEEYTKWKQAHDTGEAACPRVQKLDCIGHVQKRMGTHLRELRKIEKQLKDGKSVKGSKHRLTDKAIDKLQCYYGNAIRANVKPGKLTAEQQKSQISTMQKAIMAVLYHSCELSNNNERHKFCPEGPDSWCSYKREGKLQRKGHHLDPVFPELLLPEFERLSEYSLLLPCLPGYSQNANESINSLVWNRAPKHRNKGPKAIEMAVMSAVMQFNSGGSSRHEVMKAANIPAGVFTSEGSARKDKTRISKSLNKAKMKEKETRRKIRQAKLEAITRKEGECSYSGGRFNEMDPLGQMDSSDNFPLARLLHHSTSETSDSSDDISLGQLCKKKQCGSDLKLET